MAESVIKLNDAQLALDRAKHDYIVTAEDWRTAMKAIKDAVNNNASAATVNQSIPVNVTIMPMGTSSKYSWYYNSDNKSYYCTIPADEHSKTALYQVHFYNEYGTAVQCEHQIQKNYDLYVRSRVNAELRLVIK